MPDDKSAAGKPYPVYPGLNDKTGGTPPKITEQCIEDLIYAFERNGSIHTACGYAGISESTYYRAYRRGEEYTQYIDDGGEIIEGEDIYGRFFTRIRRGRSEYLIGAGAFVRAAWEADPKFWRAAFQTLQVADPEFWATKVASTTVPGLGGGSITIEITEVDRHLAEIMPNTPPIIDVDAEEIEVDRRPLSATSTDDDDDDFDYYVIPYAPDF